MGSRFSARGTVLCTSRAYSKQSSAGAGSSDFLNHDIKGVYLADCGRPDCNIGPMTSCCQAGSIPIFLNMPNSRICELPSGSDKLRGMPVLPLPQKIPASHGVSAAGVRKGIEPSPYIFLLVRSAPPRSPGADFQVSSRSYFRGPLLLSYLICDALMRDPECGLHSVTKTLSYRCFDGA
jgi:hypothetical protein